MANVIELVSKYIPMLDYQYQVGAKSAILDAAPDLIQETRSARKILIPKMELTGLYNYDRFSGFKNGVQTLEWVEHEFTQDRGTTFTVDIMDDIETLGVAYGRLATEFERLHLIPELDAYRFSTYATLAGHRDDTLINKSNVYTGLSDVQKTLDEDEVPEEGRVLFVSNEVYNAMKLSTEVQKKWDVIDSLDPKGISFKIERYDGIPIIRVPQRRFKTAYDFLDEDTGGFIPKEDAKSIQFLLLHPSAVMQIVKRAVTRVFAPTPDLAAQTGAFGVTPHKDAWEIQYRIYHDAFVLSNKTNGIFVSAV